MAFAAGLTERLAASPGLDGAGGRDGSARPGEESGQAAFLEQGDEAARHLVELRLERRSDVVAQLKQARELALSIGIGTAAGSERHAVDEYAVAGDGSIEALFGAKVTSPEASRRGRCRRRCR